MNNYMMKVYRDGKFIGNIELYGLGGRTILQLHSLRPKGRRWIEWSKDNKTMNNYMMKVYRDGKFIGNIDLIHEDNRTLISCSVIMRPLLTYFARCFTAFGA